MCNIRNLMIKNKKYNIGGKMKKILFFIFVIGIFSSFLYAESIKIAYVDTDRIMAESKLTKEAQQTFQNEQQQWQDKLNKMQAEIDKLSADYKAKELVLTEEGKKEAQQKLLKLDKEIKEYYNQIYGENGKAAQRNNELLKPILDKLKTVIENIAVKDNYSYILDSSSGAILYAKPAYDITDQVIEELDKAE